MANSNESELLQSGETVLGGQYKIIRYLGSGGQGQVYLVHHRTFGEEAAKRLHRNIINQQYGFERFEREVQITRNLRELHSRHIIFIRHFDKDPARDDEWFSVMDYANDGSLEDKLALQAPLLIETAIKLAIDLCQALAPVHNYPYVHGDLKPGNILFHTNPGQTKPILKLSDFGSAFKPAQQGRVPLSTSLNTARTMPYVSPELLAVSHLETEEAYPITVDQRSDIYAVGIILYEMLTGRPPFWKGSSESDSPEVQRARQIELKRQIQEESPPEPLTWPNKISSFLNNLVMKAIAKDPDDRFEDVNEMQLQLEQVLQEMKVRDAEWLVSLRIKIQKKLEEKLWLEADDLVREALELMPNDPGLMAYQETIADQLLIHQMLEQIESAKKKHNWREVTRLCREVIDQGHKDSRISRMLKQAEQEIRIEKLQQILARVQRQGNKVEELHYLKKLFVETPQDQQLAAEIGRLERDHQLASAYTRGKKAHEAKEWRTVLEVMQEVVALDPHYKDAASLLIEAQQQLFLEEKASEKRERDQKFKKLLANSALYWLVALATILSGIAVLAPGLFNSNSQAFSAPTSVIANTTVTRIVENIPILTLPTQEATPGLKRTIPPIEETATAGAAETKIVVTETATAEFENGLTAEAGTATGIARAATFEARQIVTIESAPSATPIGLSSSTPASISPLSIVETSTATPASRDALTATVIPIPAVTAASVPLLSAVVIDYQESQQDLDKFFYEGKNSFKWLRWRPWPKENEANNLIDTEFPDNWMYMIRILSANDKNKVIARIPVTRAELIEGRNERYPNGKEVQNEGWYIYSFDLERLPIEAEACYPYWDVVVVVDKAFVDCSEELLWDDVCQISSFPKRQIYLADKNPQGECVGSPGGSGARIGSDPPPTRRP